MSFSIFENTTIPVAEQVVNFAQRRHSVLAGNIANIDTPGYRVRDLNPEMFEERLGKAIKQRDAVSRSISLSDPAGQYGDPIKQVGENLEGILFHDDSNVGIEMQTTEMMKNVSRHNMALTIMRSQFRLLEAAISERA